MNQHIVILAGGKGSRMNQVQSKQFLEIEGKPVLIHTISAFLKALPQSNIIIVLPQDELEDGKKMISRYFAKIDFTYCIGGDTRFQSVKNGLACITDPNPSVVLVHDAARCLITVELILRCVDQAISKGSAIPVVPCTDSVRWSDEYGNRSLDRKHLFLVQTPQVFSSSILLPAFKKAEYQDSYTDEAAVAEAAGHKVELVEGDKMNIKITHPIDLAIATCILQELNNKA